MKALSLLQPWATLVAIGAKKIETRSWATPYRGPVAIHASKSFPGGAVQLTIREPFVSAIRAAGIINFEQFPLGKIIAVCDLVDCMQISMGDYVPEPERSFGNYTPGRWAWHLANVRALPEPIPAKGSLGLWTPAPDVLEQLERFYNNTKGTA